MEIVKGQIVASKAGHDEGKFFVVLELESGFVYLADGKERKLNNPKKKNLKHITKTDTVVEMPNSDKQLKKLLNNFSRVNQED